MIESFKRKYLLDDLKDYPKFKKDDSFRIFCNDWYDVNLDARLIQIELMEYCNSSALSSSTDENELYKGIDIKEEIHKKMIIR